MNRRKLIKKLVLSAAGLGLVNQSLLAKEKLSILESMNLPEEMAFWSYYAAFVDYEGLLTEEADLDLWDREVNFSSVFERNEWITGQQEDGLENFETFDVGLLESSGEPFIRVKFWHDDHNSEWEEGHNLYIFQRHLDLLRQGKKVFVATGMYRNHFHIVMLDPTYLGQS